MFERKWRALRLTERGQMVFRYADEIFSPCNQLAHAVRGNSTENSIRLSVGVPDVLPTLVTY